MTAHWAMDSQKGFFWEIPLMTHDFNKEYAMKKTMYLGWSLIIFALVTCRFAAAEQEHDYPLTPMSFEKVTLQDDFWLPRLKLQAESTVPHALTQTEPAVENLRRCGNFLHGRGGELPFPHRFVSSDLYKVMGERRIF